MIESLGNMTLGVALCLGMTGFGMPVVCHWFGEVPSRLERGLLAAGLGAGILSLLVMAIGLEGFLFSWVAWFLVAVGFVVVGLSLVNCKINTVELQVLCRRCFGYSRGSWISCILVGLVTTLLTFDLVAALAPPSFADACIVIWRCPNSMFNRIGFTLPGRRPPATQPLSRCCSPSVC